MNVLGESMKLTRFYATEEGASRFEEVEVPVNESRPSAAGGILKQSNPWPSPAVRFLELPSGLDQSWHHAPARQIVLVLSGCVEVETSDNQKRRCTTGQAFIADDLTGTGHSTRVIEGPATVMFVELPEGFDVAKWTAS
jgi:quercetin dioxygenase-like cupin family protein